MAEWGKNDEVVAPVAWGQEDEIADGGVEPELSAPNPQLEEDVRGILPEIFEQPILTPQQVRDQIIGPGKRTLEIQNKTGADVGEILDSRSRIMATPEAWGVKTEDEAMSLVEGAAYIHGKRRLGDDLADETTMTILSLLPFSPVHKWEEKGYIEAKRRLEAGDIGNRYEMTPMGGYQLVQRETTAEELRELIRDFEVKKAQGTTIPAAVGQGVAMLPGYIGEFAAGGALMKSLGLAATVPTKVTGVVSVAKAVGRALTQAGVTTAIQPHRVTGALADFEMAGDSGMTAVAKAYGSTYIENLTELTGEGFNVVGKGIIDQLPMGAKIFNRIKGAAAKIGIDEATFMGRVVKKGGWNGIISEIGEERMNTVLYGVFAIDDFGAGPDSTIRERVTAGLKQDMQAQNMLIESLILLTPGGVKILAKQAGKVYGEHPEIEEAMSVLERAVQVDQDQQQAEAADAQAEEAGAEGAAPLAAGPQEPAPGSEEVQREVPEAEPALQNQGGQAGASVIDKSSTTAEAVVAPEAAGAAEGVKPTVKESLTVPAPEQAGGKVNRPEWAPDKLAYHEETGKPGLSVEQPYAGDEVFGRHRIIVYRDENGKALGTIEFRVKDDGTLEDRVFEDTKDSMNPIEVFVDPKYRRKGIATAMWQFAKQQGYDFNALKGQLYTEEGEAFAKPGGKQVQTVGVSEQVPTKAEAVPAPAETGVQWAGTVYRGIGKGGPTDYGFFGKGTYYTTEPRYAEMYGEVTSHTVILKNPFVIKTAEEALKFQNEAFRGNVRKQLEETGYDSIVVTKEALGEPGKPSRRDEIVLFHPEIQAKATLPSPKTAEIVPPAKRGEAEKATTTIGQPAITAMGEVPATPPAAKPATETGTAQPEIDSAVSEWQTSVGAASFAFGESRDAISRAILESQQNLKPRYVVQNDEGKFDVLDNPPEKGHYTSVDMSRPVDEQVVFIKQASPTIEEAFDYGEHPKESQKQWTDLERFKAKLKEETANAQSIADELLHYVKNLPLADQAKFTPLLMKISPDQRATTNVKDLMAGIVKVQRILSGNEKADAISELKKVYHTIRKKYREGREVLGKLDNAARDRIFDLMGTIDLTKMTGAKEKQLESLGKAVNELAKELGTAAKEMNTSLAAELLEVPEGQIEELARLGKTSIHEMDAEDIRQITDTLLYIVNQWEVSKSEAHEKRVAGVRTRVVSAIQNVHKRVKRIGEVVETFPVIRYVKGRAQSRIDTLVKRSMGKDHAAATSLLMDDLEIGQEKTFGKFFEMADYEAAQLTAIGWDNAAHKGLNELVTVSLGGETFEIPIRKLAVLYAHMQSEDNYAAILKSEGLVIRYKTREAKRGYSSAYRTIYTNQVTAEELMSAVAGLPDVYKQLVRVMFETNEKLAAPAMNETSLRLKATEIAKIKNYVHRPRETDANVEGGTMDVSVAPEHRGRAQPRTGGTRRIVLGNIDDEMIAQMQFAAEYYGMTEPLENARALLNNKDFNGTMNKSGQGENLKSIKKQFRRAQGVFADQTVLEKRMNRSLAKVGRSILSLRVSGGLVQLTSPPTSWGVIDAKYFVGVLPGTPSEIAALKERYAVLRNRWDLGGFHFIIGDVAGAQVFRNLLMGKSEVLNKPLHHYTWGDEGAISMIYKATRRKVAGETPFEDGSAEFENAVDNLFRVAMRTQGQYDMLHRSEITSDPNPFWRGSTMFMSSLNAFYNTVLQATDDARKGRISSVRATETMAGIGIAIALAVMVRRAFVKGGKWLVQALLAAILPPDEEEKENLARLEADIPAEMKKELRALPGRIAFESLGLMVFGRVFATIGRRVADKIAGKNYQDRPSRMETGNIFTDLVLDLTELGGDAGTLAGQIARDEEFESGLNEGKKKWKPTARRVTDELAGLVAYRFGLPYSAIQSDFGQPAGQIIEAIRISRMTTDELDTEIEKNTYKEASEDETREAGDPHKGKELYVSMLLTELRKR